jgi:hypothetical protein
MFPAGTWLIHDRILPQFAAFATARRAFFPTQVGLSHFDKAGMMGYKSIIGQLGSQNPPALRNLG